jgi:hypothetical protein
MKSDIEYIKKYRLMRKHQTVEVIAGSLQGDWLDCDDPSERELKDGLFFMVK